MVLRAREILVRRVPVYMLILAVLAVVLTALITFSALVQVPPVVEFVKAFRSQTVTVTITDATFTSVTLEDTELDGKADKAVVEFSTDGSVDGAVKVTVTLKGADGTTLDSGYETITVTAAGSYMATVRLSNLAVMAYVKLIEIKFEQVTG
ncbi:MAG: hypothetical protein ACO2OZ_06235 [Acidilobaceae archaeon]